MWWVSTCGFCSSVASSMAWLSRSAGKARRFAGDLPVKANNDIMPWFRAEWSLMALNCCEPRPISLRVSASKMSLGCYWGVASWFMMLIVGRQKFRLCMPRTPLPWLATILKTVCW